MRWAGTYPITDFLSDAGHKLTDNKTSILEHDIGTISAFNVSYRAGFSSGTWEPGSQEIFSLTGNFG